MGEQLHTYDLKLFWTGNRGTGTSAYRAYGRDHTVTAAGAGTLAGSSDPTFRGDASRWNPEQLLVAALAQCHLLTYLHLCVEAGIVVIAYLDQPHGVMATNAAGAGQFTSVTLQPRVQITDSSRVADAVSLHDRVGEFCFIARSVNFPVRHTPQVSVDAVLPAGFKFDHAPQSALGGSPTNSAPRPKVRVDPEVERLRADRPPHWA